MPNVREGTRIGGHGAGFGHEHEASAARGLSGLLRGGGDAAKSGAVGRPCKNWQRCYATGEEMDPLNLQENRAARWGHFTPADLS